MAHDIDHIADYQVAGPWRIPYLVALPVESLKLFDPSFSLSLIRLVRQVWVQRLVTCDYLQDSRGIEKGLLPEGIELWPEGNGAALPSLLTTPGLWSSESLSLPLVVLHCLLPEPVPQTPACSIGSP